MAQSLSRIPRPSRLQHQENREPFITTEHRERLFAYLGGTLNNIDCSVIAVGGVSDHVRLLFVLRRTASISEVVEQLKKESSK